MAGPGYAAMVFADVDAADVGKILFQRFADVVFLDVHVERIHQQLCVLRADQFQEVDTFFHAVEEVGFEAVDHFQIQSHIFLRGIISHLANDRSGVLPARLAVLGRETLPRGIQHSVEERSSRLGHTVHAFHQVSGGSLADCFVRAAGIGIGGNARSANDLQPQFSGSGKGFLQRGVRAAVQGDLCTVKPQFFHLF